VYVFGGRLVVLDVVHVGFVDVGGCPCQADLSIILTESLLVEVEGEVEEVAILVRCKERFIIDCFARQHLREGVGVLYLSLQEAEAVRVRHGPYSALF
jgi:hypothetical protein